MIFAAAENYNYRQSGCFWTGLCDSLVSPKADKVYGECPANPQVRTGCSRDRLSLSRHEGLFATQLWV